MNTAGFESVEAENRESKKRNTLNSRSVPLFSLPLCVCVCVCVRARARACAC